MLTTAAGPGTRGIQALAQGLLEHDRWSREQLLAHQHEQLRSLLEHAVARSPYYREVLGTDVLAADVGLADIPTLPKATLMEQFDRVVSDPRLRLSELDAHIAGPGPAELLFGEYHVFSTSGTTGRRGVFPQPRGEFARWVAAAWRMRARMGHDGAMRTIGIAAPTPLHITQKLFAALGGFGHRRPALVATMPITRLVDELNRDQPDAIFTIPSLMGMLAEEQLQGRLAIEPRSVVVAGEMVTDEVVARVQDAWRIKPFQVYASTEALMMSSESVQRVGLHISEDLVLLEVVDDRNQPVAAGMPGHRVLLTSLVNRALPLIRYELGDSVRIAPGPDPSGLPYQRLESVDGRNDDILRLAAPGGGEAVVLPGQLRAVFAHLPDVVQFQVMRERQRIVVRVVLRPGSSADTSDRIAGRLRVAFKAAGAVVPAISVEPVAEIEREPGAAKLKLVKSVA
jgi:phenylacetate-coenzyme A ligase PaaK-like adenylate-forming protein